VSLYRVYRGYAPTLGIMGSVLGVIQAMANLDMSRSVGAMVFAVAFVSKPFMVRALQFGHASPISKNNRALPVNKEIAYHQCTH